MNKFALLPMIILAICVAVWLVPTRKKDSAVTDAAWVDAVGAETSQIGRWMLSAAKPISKTPAVYGAASSRQYVELFRKVSASGLHLGSPEIFLSVQMASIVLGVFLMTTIIALDLGLMLTVVFLIIASIVTIYPYHRVNAITKQKTEAVNLNLPEFAEMLLLSLRSGSAVRSALDFTATKGGVDGPVSDEVAALIDRLNSGSMGERDAYALAGERLGTQEALSFFNALAKADIEGARVVDTVEAQVESLRLRTYQMTRERAKKLPTKFVVIVFLHLILSLMVLIMIPTMLSISSAV